MLRAVGLIACVLMMLHAKGELKLGGKFEHLNDAAAWKTFCDELAELDWVSLIRPPPTKSSAADQVVRYLTRYLTGGPISDSRIVAADANFVIFMAREGKRVGGERRQVPVTIPTLEFVRRWCEHIQSEQLTKTRYFGGWCSRNRTEYQERCQRLLGLDQDPAAEQVAEPDSTQADSARADSNQCDSTTLSTQPAIDSRCTVSIPQCPACAGSALRLIAHTPKPEWSVVLSHLDKRCPEWYAETEYAEFCAYLEREYGISYEDWDLETRIESTMSEPRPAVARQLYLPGLCPESGYLIESY